MFEVVSFKGGVIFIIFGIIEDEYKKFFVLDMIFEGIREGDINKDNGIVKVENLDDLNLEEVESVF